MYMLIFERSSQLGEEYLRFEEFPLTAAGVISQPPIQYRYRDTAGTYFQNASQECHCIAFHSILEICTVPHTQLLHSRVGRPSPDWELVFFLDNVNESNFFHELFGMVPHSKVFTQNLASLSYQRPPSAKRTVWCDSAIVRPRVWGSLVVF
jgi:hypothetical protein